MMNHNHTTRGADAFTLASWLIFCCLGAYLGTRLADIDFKIPGLVHRSIVTHGFLLPLALFVVASRYKHQLWLVGFTCGFLPTSAAHLCFDLWPRGWQGGAYIYAPFVGRLPLVMTWLWIAVSILCCLYLAGRFMSTALELVLSVGSLVYASIHHAHEGLLYPLLTIGVAIAAVLLFPGQRISSVLTRTFSRDIAP